MTPDEIAALEANIVDICKAHKAENSGKRGYRAFVFAGPRYGVKYGNPQTLLPEIKTQKYVFDYAESQPGTPCAPCIPKVEHYFQKERTMYLVMKRITFMVPPSDFTERVAGVLKWLSEVKPPPDHVIGPLGAVASAVKSSRTSWHLYLSRASMSWSGI